MATMNADRTAEAGNPAPGRSAPVAARAGIRAVLVLATAVSAAEATTYRVGPTRTYKNLQAVAGLLNPGDVVEVDGNATYPGNVTFDRPGTAANPIVVRGIPLSGRRPVLTGGTMTVHFRTDTIGEGADHYVMEGFEITGASERCVFHQSAGLVLRDVVVHDCAKTGILGADWGAGSITVEHSEVYRCGGDTQDHQIYIGMDEDNYPTGVFRLQYSWIHDGDGGNNVKSRAARNEIYYNRIEGAYYHELELIGAECCEEGVVREDSDVVGNLLIRKGSNADFFVTRFGGDGTGQTWGRYRFVNNTVIAGSGAVFRLHDGLESLEAHNNVFYRSSGPVTILRTAEASWANGERIAGSKNWVVTGSTTIPAQWTGTITGSNPGFTNAAGGDYTPAAGSPLLNVANPAPTGPPGYPFPSPLFPPAYHPPGPPLVFGVPNPRAADGLLDIGAYERPSPRLSIGDVSVTEGSSGTTSATFTVNLTAGATGAVTVDYASANGTATAPGDYAAAAGTLTFAPGQMAKSLPVAVTGDTVDEPNETFLVVLTNAVGASVTDGQGQGTIVDDDPTPIVSIGDATAVEGNAGSTDAVLVARLTNASAQAVAVSFATADNTAAAGSDYTARSGMLIFPAESAAPQSVPVPVIGDTLDEPTERFSVVLSSPANAVLGDAEGVGTILDDDGGAFRIGEMVHGSDVRADLRAQPGPAADQDLYLLALGPYSAWEVLVDEASGDVGTGSGPRLERLAADRMTVVASSVAAGNGLARSLRIRNTTGATVDAYVSVRSNSCTTTCGADDVYRIRAWETTGAIPRFNNSGTQTTVVILQNATSRTTAGTVSFWSTAGARLASQSFSLAARATLVLNSASVPALIGQSGTITVEHDGRYGDLAGKAVALESSTGFSFDSPLEYRDR